MVADSLTTMNIEISGAIVLNNTSMKALALGVVTLWMARCALAGSEGPEWQARAREAVNKATAGKAGISQASRE